MPNRFLPIGSDTDPSMAMAQINQNFAVLDAEAATKRFKDASGNALTMGALGNNLFGIKFDLGTNGSMFFGPYKPNRFGQVWYDSSGQARILVGQAPDDGRMGTWISKPGQDVITLLGG